MIRKAKAYLKQPLIILGLFFVSCGADDASKKVTHTQVENKPEKPAAPFAFYKDISVRPGLNFEVISWGKGIDSVGGYMVLLSDTTKKTYKSLSNEREGMLADAWNMDLDNDGNPEVYIELLIDNKMRSDLHVFEFASGNFNKITFPGLSARLKKNYAGQDKFFIRDGELYRRYNLTGESQDGQPATGTKTLHYSLSGNQFSVEEAEIK